MAHPTPNLEPLRHRMAKKSSFGDSDEASDGSISITSVEDAPPASPKMACIARFRYGVWRAEFKTGYDAANDSFDGFQLGRDECGP